MPKPSYASVAIDVDPKPRPLPIEPGPDTPFRILLLCDFSGRSNRGEPPPEHLRAYPIDRDTVDEVMFRMRPALQFGGPAAGLLMRFNELEDFHPDRIYGQDVFQKLRAAQLLHAAPALIGGSLLDSVLETTEGQPPRHSDLLQDFIQRAVAPHTLPREDPRVAARTAEVAAAAGSAMRAVLHHPDFQKLEAPWRALHWLVRSLETGPLLKVYVIDFGKADLAGSLRGLKRILVDDAVLAPGGEPWTLVVADFAFARTASDIQLLRGLAGIMHAAGAVLVAEADPADADSQEAAHLWQELRHLPEASSIGLALPRFLLRLPFGQQTAPIESFAFEEMPGAPDHQAYLWGNPGFACAHLLGQEFSRDGWSMRPGSHSVISGLPLHVYEAEGEQQLKPCAEVVLSEADADWILDQGFMPLVSVKGQDEVRLLRFQSIAHPLAPLSGRWT